MPILRPSPRAPRPTLPELPTKASPQPTGLGLPSRSLKVIGPTTVQPIIPVPLVQLTQKTVLVLRKSKPTNAGPRTTSLKRPRTERV